MLFLIQVRTGQQFREALVATAKVQPLTRSMAALCSIQTTRPETTGLPPCLAMNTVTRFASAQQSVYKTLSFSWSKHNLDLIHRLKEFQVCVRTTSSCYKKTQFKSDHLLFKHFSIRVNLLVNNSHSFFIIPHRLLTLTLVFLKPLQCKVNHKMEQ